MDMLQSNTKLRGRFVTSDGKHFTADTVKLTYDVSTDAFLVDMNLTSPTGSTIVAAAFQVDDGPLIPVPFQKSSYVIGRGEQLQLHYTIAAIGWQSMMLSGNIPLASQSVTIYEDPFP